jgi:putative methionine-R-sulfoxide reductase with GAF domain
VAEDKNKPLFDENVLGRLLEAAYVVQEYNLKKRPSTPQRLDEAGSKRESLPETTRSESSQTSGLPATSAAESKSAIEAISSTPASASSAPSKDRYTATLAQIVAIQRRMQLQHLEGDDSLVLIAERIADLVNAGGAAIGILEGDKIRYRATSGQMTPTIGAEVPKDEALCWSCLQTSEAFHCENVDSELLVDEKECSRRRIQSMIAVPVFHGGAVVGGLELYYASPSGFTDQDVQTAQLMTGLITESLAREEERSWKKSMASERAVMLEALEKLKPNLAALVDASAAKESAVKTAATAPQPASLCAKCGHQLLEEEQFCGKCGTARTTDAISHEALDLQSKVASLWQMQQGTGQDAMQPSNGAADLDEAAPGFDDAQFEKMLSESLAQEMPELFQAAGSTTGDPAADTEAASAADSSNERSVDAASAGQTSPEELLSDSGDEEPSENEELEERDELQSASLAKAQRTPDWSSAANAREFLEQVAAHRSNGVMRFLQARRGDLYLALAVMLVVIVIRWGIWANHPARATAGGPNAAQTQKAAPDADLPWYDRALIKFGLAEAPPTVESKGDPKTPVWVDLRTGLYYCPGTDLYGKTPKGKFETQRSAQLDEFQPATRKACD